MKMQVVPFCGTEDWQSQPHLNPFFQYCRSVINASGSFFVKNTEEVNLNPNPFLVQNNEEVNLTQPFLPVL